MLPWSYLSNTDLLKHHPSRDKRVEQLAEKAGGDAL